MAAMSVNVAKTKVLRIVRKIQVPNTKEAEVEAALKHPHACDQCGITECHARKHKKEDNGETCFTNADIPPHRPFILHQLHHPLVVFFPFWNLYH